MITVDDATPGQRARALWLSTFAFSICFAVWVIFSIVGVELQQELGLSGTQFGLLVAVPVLTGALSRPVLGILAEMVGAHRVFTLLMLVVAAFTFLLPYAHTYAVLLLIGLGLGVAGGAFAVGVVYTSAWYPRERQGMALGLFGMGNVGAALTGMAAPALLMVMDWRQVAWVYCALMLATAVLFFLVAQREPVRADAPSAAPSLRERMAPLRNLQVWRFAMYYFLVFGGFVALASWMPRYYMGAYGVDLASAGMLTASFVLPATLFRAVGGVLSDRYGARRMMYISFSVCMVGLFLLSYPNTHYVIEGIQGPISFTIAPSLAERAIVLALLGFMMAIGMAAVFKHIPTYYPEHVGAVGGVVGMIGGLGGFFLPIAFGAMNDLTGIWSSCFMLLFVVALASLLWMHFAILRMNRQRHPQIKDETDLPEIMASVLKATQHAQAAAKAADEAVREANAVAKRLGGKGNRAPHAGE